ncbi:MAG TPA: diguanylate cyclase [Solirubrobacteraceae bacterium]
MSDDYLDPRLAERLTRAARAAQTLSETLWEALREELADPRSERVAEISERLGEVAAVVASLAHVDARAREETAEPVKAEPVEQELRVARATTYGEPLSEKHAPSGEPAETQTSPSPAVLIDELVPTAATGPQAPPRPEIEIRDERAAEGPAAWIDSIGRRLERHEQDRSPFAVLLVELVDVERLRRAEPAEELARLMGRVEDALARELRPADSLTRERPGRYWLLAPQTDGPAAQVLLERIARAVRSSASHRGTPLEVAVGVAVCPEDGLRASELAAHADVGLYAARAAGRPSIG